MLLAVLTKNLDAVNMYLEAGDDPSPFLIPAITKSSSRVVKTLLAVNADPNCVDDAGNSPLGIAIKKNKPRIIKYLLKAGADVEHLSSKGTPPIVSAGKAHNPKIVELLIEYKADVNTQDKHQRTALHQSRRWDDDRYKCLLQAGADPNIKDDEGETVTKMAQEKVVLKNSVLKDQKAEIKETKSRLKKQYHEKNQISEEYKNAVIMFNRMQYKSCWTVKIRIHIKFQVVRSITRTKIEAYFFTQEDALAYSRKCKSECPDDKNITSKYYLVQRELSKMSNQEVFSIGKRIS